MSKIKNLVYLLIFGGILFSLKFFIIDRFFTFLPKDANIWFTSGLLLIILGVFITEKYFTRSLDVVVNVITLTVVLLTLDKPGEFYLWGAVFYYGITVGFIALTSFILFDEDKDPNLFSQKISNVGSVVARFLGSSRMLFSIVFILSIFNYFIFSLQNNQSISENQVYILCLIVFWGAAILIEPIDRKFIEPIIKKIKDRSVRRMMGRVIRRMSPNIVITERLPSIMQMNPGDIAYIGESEETLKREYAMYLYSQESESKKYDFFFSFSREFKEYKNQCYIFSLNLEEQRSVLENFNDNELIKNKNNLIGFVGAGSNIDVLKIHMIEGVDISKLLKEGDMISVSVYENPTKYQMINVETVSESVEGKSRQGKKIITAQQIGFWKNESQKFENIGWVPEVNTPVFVENTDGEQIPELGDCNHRIGLIPKSKYPIYINFDETITHHLAIIGKTGTGKSRMAAKIVNDLVANDYKVVILEVDKEHPQSLSKRIDQTLISSSRTTWRSSVENRRRGNRSNSETVWSCDINFDPADNKKVFVVNLDTHAADLEGGPLSHSESASAVVKNILIYKNRPENVGKKICIVMEEAYDFIPENTFGQQDFGQPNVSRIAQLLLKCRKHNIGFLIITQRTALVSKTILYQCNTIIALQSFDETSKNFMSAYISQKYLESMSILPRFRAIVVGKGSSCDKPVIVDFEERGI